MAYARELTDLLVQIDLAYFVNGEEKWNLELLGLKKKNGYRCAT
jgi:hypothetical protein